MRSDNLFQVALPNMLLLVQIWIYLGGNYQVVTSLLDGTIIRTGITCKKIRCYMGDSACRWFIAKTAKIFEKYVKHF